MAFVHRNFIRLQEHRIFRPKLKLLDFFTIPNLLKVPDEAPGLAGDFRGVLLELLVKEREHVVLEQIFLV